MEELVLVSAKKERNARPYVEALKAVDVPPERIRIVTREDEPAVVRELATKVAGVVLCGGADVDPQRYGEQVLPEANVHVDAERDRVEWALLDGARDARVPVWAICRGMQVVNAYLGGSLWQDLPTQLLSEINHYPKDEPKSSTVHEVQVVNSHTALGGVLGSERLDVNSRHHQAVKDLAPGLVAAAVAPDGLLEACELPPDAGWWLRAVQWHPEDIVALAPQRELFRAFARAARGAR